MDSMEDGELPPSPNDIQLEPDLGHEEIPYTPLLRPEAIKQTGPGSINLTRARSGTHSSVVAHVGDSSDLDDHAVVNSTPSGSSSPKSTYCASFSGNDLTATGMDTVALSVDDPLEQETPATRILKGLQGSSSDTDSSDSDMETGGRPQRKMRRSSNQGVRNYGSGGELFQKMAAQFQQDLAKIQSNSNSNSCSPLPLSNSRKTNNVWGSVLQEETLSSDLTGIGVRAIKKLEMDRGAETYDYTLAQSQAAARTDQLAPTHNMELLYFQPDGSGSRLESTSPIDDDLRGRRQDAIRAGKKRSVKDRLGHDHHRRHQNHHQLRDTIGGQHLDNMSIPQPGKSRTIADISSSLLELLEEVADENMDVATAGSSQCGLSSQSSPKAQLLGEELAAKLSEPKTELMTGVVDLVGSVITLELFAKTQEIEKNGGMMTKNGSRRRTPGGVFLHLLREMALVDQRVDAQKIKKFFTRCNQNSALPTKQNAATNANFQSELDDFRNLSQKRQLQLRAKQLDQQVLPDILKDSAIDVQDLSPPEVPPNSVERIERTISIYEEDVNERDVDAVFD